jgi:hypothetical protein
MWPRGHISTRMRSASFGLRLVRQCERGPRCTLLPDQLDFARSRRWVSALFMVGASRTIPREDFLPVAASLEAAHETLVSRYGRRC